jgi:hypothetical protein
MVGDFSKSHNKNDHRMMNGASFFLLFDISFMLVCPVFLFFVFSVLFVFSFCVFCVFFNEICA